jgi:hypothetical protein
MLSSHVRFGSKADISECPTHVRFTPESGHCVSGSGCPLCANRDIHDWLRKPFHGRTPSALGPASVVPSCDGCGDRTPPGA